MNAERLTQNHPLTSVVCCMQTSRDRLLWSCAKQLKPQLSTPTPHAFPPGIVPTTRGQSRHDASAPHPQSSRLAFPGANYQQLVHDEHTTVAALHEDRLCPAADSVLPQLPARSGVTDAAAVLTTTVQLDESAAEQVPFPIPDQAQEGDAEAELTFACQQLAEAAANHAKQKAMLEQALSAHTADSPSAQIGPPDAASSAADSYRPQSTDCSAICADSVDANTPTHYQPAAALETGAPDATAAGATASACIAPGAAALDAAAAHQGQSSSPDRLSASCRELSQVASAHAAQRAELETLMHRQLEASTSAAAPCRLVASSDVGCAWPRPLRGPGFPAAHKSRAHSKLNVKPKRPRSAVDTAAWPPGPQQAAGVQHVHSVQAVRCEPQSSTRLLARKTTNVGSKTVSSHLIQPAEAMLAALEPNSLGTDNAALPPDACLTRLPGLVADAAYSEQRLPLAADTAAQASNEEQARHSAVADRDLYAECRADGLSQQPVSSAAPSTSGAETLELCLLDSQASITEQTAVSVFEPSFDTVHTMLSALHLPKLGLPQSQDSGHDEALHIQSPVVWSVKTAAAEGGQLQVSQSPGKL